MAVESIGKTGHSRGGGPGLKTHLIRRGKYGPPHARTRTAIFPPFSMAHDACFCRLRRQSAPRNMKAQNSPRAGRLILGAGRFLLRPRRLVLAAIMLLASLAAAPVLRTQAPAPPAAPSGPDALEYDAAERLFKANKFKEAGDAFGKFLAKYKMLSPRSLDAKFHLAVALVQEGQYDEAITHLRELITNPKIDLAAREMAQLLVAKSLTMKASKLPADTAPQKDQIGRASCRERV